MYKLNLLVCLMSIVFGCVCCTFIDDGIPKLLLLVYNLVWTVWCWWLIDDL